MYTHMWLEFCCFLSSFTWGRRKHPYSTLIRIALRIITIVRARNVAVVWEFVRRVAQQASKKMQTTNRWAFMPTCVAVLVLLYRTKGVFSIKKNPQIYHIYKKIGKKIEFFIQFFEFFKFEKNRVFLVFFGKIQKLDFICSPSEPETLWKFIYTIF